MEPLGEGAISERKGPGGKMLSYVGQHYVRRRLCEVCGPLGFSTTTERRLVTGPTWTKEVRHKRGGGTYEVEHWVTTYDATVTLTVHTEDGPVTKDGSAAGVGEDKQIGWSIHLAVTEAETDALKRAAMQLGDSFGLALYDKSQSNVVSDRELSMKRNSAAEGGRVIELLEGGKVDGAKELARKVWKYLDADQKKTIETAVAKAEAAE